MLRIFEIGGNPSENSYLFLGDYIDRGMHSIETICLQLAYKIKYPKTFHLLRGNHESASISRQYGFFDECKRRYNIKMWKNFCDVFNLMPVAAIVEQRMLCMHGGLSQYLKDPTGINDIVRPTEIPEEGLLCDLLWADPSTAKSDTWNVNDRGISFVFGEKVVNQYLATYDLDLIVRAHQVVEEGYEFFANKRLVTVFSAPNYCGEYDNAGAIMTVDVDLVCNFKILNFDKKSKTKFSISDRPSTPVKKKNG